MPPKRYALVDKNRCVACGSCLAECPRSAIKIIKGCYAQVAEDLCLGCGKCAAICPAESIALVLRKEQ